MKTAGTYLKVKVGDRKQKKTNPSYLGTTLLSCLSPSVTNEHERKSCPRFLGKVEYHRGIRQTKGGVFCLIFRPTRE